MLRAKLKPQLYNTIVRCNMSTVSRTPLLESTAAAQPSEQLHRWLKDAKDEGIPLPTVSSLATAALPSGRVSNRMIVVKEVSEDGQFYIYSDWERSHKARDVQTNPNVALTFYWRELDRSLRVEETIKRLSKGESLPYFNSRTHDFQAGVSIGNQTQVVPDRGALESKLHDLDNKKELDIPEWWGGAVVTPDYFEFWQGREDRIHDRLEYVLNDEQWTRKRLTP